MFGAIFSSDGTCAAVHSAEPPPGLAAAAAAAGAPPPRRFEIVLAENEFIRCIVAWWGPPGEGRRGDLIGSISVTLNSHRVFRFGSSWFPQWQFSPCSPTFDETVPAGAHILGISGLRRPDGGIVSVGVVFARAAAVVDSPRPYQARGPAPTSPRSCRLRGLETACAFGVKPSRT